MKVVIVGSRFVSGTSRKTGEPYQYVNLHCMCKPSRIDHVGDEVFECNIYPNQSCFERAKALKPNTSIDADILINNFKKGISDFH